MSLDGKNSSLRHSQLQHRLQVAAASSGGEDLVFEEKSPHPESTILRSTLLDRGGG
jgi:hypothetical protein